MSYLDEHLLPGEQVVFRTTLHPLYLAPGSLVVLLGLLAMTNPDLGAVSVVVLLIGLGMLLSRGLTFTTNQYGVTSTRVIIKTGWGSRKTLELQLQKVEGVSVDQSLFGRFFDYGTLRIGGTGGTKETFKFIKSPIVFRKTLQEEIGKQGVTAPHTVVDSNRLPPRSERNCPWCAERILVEARICKHCGREVAAVTQ